MYKRIIAKGIDQFQISSTSFKIAEILLAVILIVNYFDYFVVKDLFFVETSLLSAIDVKEIVKQHSLLPVEIINLLSDVTVNILLFLGMLVSLANVTMLARKEFYLFHFLILTIFYERFPFVFGPADLALRTTVIWFYFLSESIKNPVDLFSKTGRYSLYVSIFWRIQIICIYMISTYEKLKFKEWSQDFNAIALISQVERHITVWASSILNELPLGITRTLTFGSLILEGFVILFLLLPFSRIKLWLPICFLVFHVIIFSMMKVHLISFVAIVWWISFLPQSFWNKTNLKNITCLQNNSRPLENIHFIQFFVIYFLLISTVSSALTQLDLKNKTITFFSKGVSYLNLNQNWTMYSNPEMLAKNSYVIIRAKKINGKEINPINRKGVNYLLNPIKERDENAMFVVNFYKRFIIDKSEFPKKYLTKVLCKNDLKFKSEDKITSFDTSIVTPEKSMLFIQPIIFGKCP